MDCVKKASPWTKGAILSSLGLAYFYWPYVQHGTPFSVTQLVDVLLSSLPYLIGALASIFLVRIVASLLAVRSESGDT